MLRLYAILAIAFVVALVLGPLYRYLPERPSRKKMRRLLRPWSRCLEWIARKTKPLKPKKKRKRRNPLLRPPISAEERHRRKRAKARGRAGERKLLGILQESLDEDRYEVLSNIMLPNEFGRTTEIDCLVVSEFGVFVIEAKNCYGEITVQDGDSPWLQKPAENIQNELRSPLLQNEGHVRALMAATMLPRSVIFPLVVFANRAKFTDAPPEGVCYFSEIVDVIASHAEPLIKPEQVPEIVDAILAWDQSITPEQRAEHVERLLARRR